jgi:hypothetical protein
MEYLEDWNFLIMLLGAGMRFSPLFETLSEFRIFSDGNTAQKRFPDLFSNCQKMCFDNGKRAAAALGLPFFYESLLHFNFDRREPLDDCPRDHVVSARTVFEVEWLGSAG